MGTAGRRAARLRPGEYADHLLLECLDAIAAETGQPRVFLAGHSLGGTLAAIFAALHPDRLRGLALLEAPLHFAPDGGALERMVAVAPPAPLLAALLGNVPGAFLDLVSVAASPSSFVWARWLDWIASLPDPQACLTHLRVVRWTLDALPLARQLFEEVVELLYRQDRFLRGTLLVGGRRAAPEQVEAPLLSVVDPRSQLVPSQAVVPFHAASGSADLQVVYYRGDIGVALQHVGTLVGRSARQEVWPAIFRWIDRRWRGRDQRGLPSGRLTDWSSSGGEKLGGDEPVESQVELFQALTSGLRWAMSVGMTGSSGARPGDRTRAWPALCWAGTWLLRAAAPTVEAIRLMPADRTHREDSKARLWGDVN